MIICFYLFEFKRPKLSKKNYWFKESNGRFKEFKDLWENCMIRVTSEAVCETLGSMMNQHGGKNRHLSPTYFSMELVLRFNLGDLISNGIQNLGIGVA